ncbi:MAG: serine hydrolase domain-containing protein [Planctomycetota bacterium]|jgi:CubicO group peptidase (beta-lactamase class C family)
MLTLLSIAMTALALCVLSPAPLEGIWHTEQKYFSGQTVDMEFELEKSFFGNEWRGRWEMKEVLISGELSSIEVAGSTVKMAWSANLTFEGSLSDDGATLQGTLFNSGKEIPQSYARVDEWASLLPARMDADGKAITDWSYEEPDQLDDGWTVGTLSEAGIRQAPIGELMHEVLNGEYRGLDAVLVARNGTLVLEEYFHFGEREELHQIQSVTKSVTSLVMGVAFDESLLGRLQRPVYEFFPGREDCLWMKEQYPITLQNALMMSAGLEWNEKRLPYTDSRNDAIRMNVSGDMYGYMLSRAIAEGRQPGEVFAYTSGLSILLGGVMLEATGMDIDLYAKKTLFEKLGIRDYFWSRHADQVHTGGGLSMKPRDLLKLGQLVLDKGRWKGEQVVSEAWIAESTAFRIPVTGHWKGKGYGYQWWREEFRVGARTYPTIFGSGYGYQMLWIVPDLDLVVMVMHHNPERGGGNHSLIWREMEKVILPSVEAD